jgi:hypothetical protein
MTAGESGPRSAGTRQRCTACWYNCRGEIESLYTLRGLRPAPLSSEPRGPSARRLTPELARASVAVRPAAFRCRAPPVLE